MNTPEITIKATSCGNIYATQFNECSIEVATDKQSLQIIHEETSEHETWQHFGGTWIRVETSNLENYPTRKWTQTDIQTLISAIKSL